VREAALTVAQQLAPRGRVLVTRGRQPTLVATNEKAFPTIREFEVDPDARVANIGPVIDTNGAGDAFAGGFLAGDVVWGLPLAKAVTLGHVAAGVTVRRHGAGEWADAPNAIELSIEAQEVR
jgi:ribokinase